MVEEIDGPTGLPIAVLQRWSLGCEGSTRNLADGTRHHDLTLIRVLEELESERVLAAAELLHRQVNSPYNRLNDKFTALFAGIDQAKEVFASRGGKPPDLRDRFAEALTAFRIYLNHIPPWLREQHGEHSAVEAAWKRACAEEYDRSFEYRLAYNLRNESDHRSNVIDVTFKARVTGPQSAVRQVTVSLNEEVLNRAASDQHWQARVREELRTHPRPIHADELMRSVYASLQRILAKTILAEREGIDSAISTVHTLTRNVDCDGTLVLMRYALAGPDWPRTTQELTIQPVPTGPVKVMEKALAEAAKILWPAFIMPISCAGPTLDLLALEPQLASNPAVLLVAVRLDPNVGHVALVRATSGALAKQAVIEAGLAIWPPGSGLRVGPPVRLKG
jgi:hypothetical protein